MRIMGMVPGRLSVIWQLHQQALRSHHQLACNHFWSHTKMFLRVQQGCHPLVPLSAPLPSYLVHHRKLGLCPRPLRLKQSNYRGKSQFCSRKVTSSRAPLLATRCLIFTGNQMTYALLLLSAFQFCNHHPKRRQTLTSLPWELYLSREDTLFCNILRHSHSLGFMSIDISSGHHTHHQSI